MTIEATVGHLDQNTVARSAPSANSPDKIRDSARQFEALLIGQLMRTMRESSGGGLGSGDDQAGASMSEFAEQQMAQVLSANGGFGLASLIEQGLNQTAQPRKTETAPAMPTTGSPTSAASPGRAVQSGLHQAPSHPPH